MSDGYLTQVDFFGAVFHAAVAAMDGCPWVDRKHVLEIAEGVAETVTDRIEQVESFFLPDYSAFSRACHPPLPQKPEAHP